MQQSALEHQHLRQPDRREHSRKDFYGQIYFATKRRIYEGTLKNLSPQGLFIESEEISNLGEPIFVALPSDDIYDLKFKGRIVWRTQKGFGARIEPAATGPKPKT